MGTKGKSITKNQFMNYFGKLQSFLVECRKPEKGYYITGVEIVDLSKSNEIYFGFTVEYGPVANIDYDGGLDVKMLECRMGYIFSRDGKFKGYDGEEPSQNMDFHPEHCNAPTFEDFPDPKDGETNLFGVIECVISKCMDCGRMLSSIQFRTLSPEFDYDYSEGIAATWNSPSEPAYFDGWSSGLCLKEVMKEDYNYCWTLQRSKLAEGEYDLVFWVKKAK